MDEEHFSPQAGTFHALPEPPVGAPSQYGWRPYQPEGPNPPSSGNYRSLEANDTVLSTSFTVFAPSNQGTFDVAPGAMAYPRLVEEPQVCFETGRFTSLSLRFISSR